MSKLSPGGTKETLAEQFAQEAHRIILKPYPGIENDSGPISERKRFMEFVALSREFLRLMNADEQLQIMVHYSTLRDLSRGVTHSILKAADLAHAPPLNSDVRPQAGHAGWPAHLPQISGPARGRRPHCQSCWLRIGGGMMAALHVFRSIELSGEQQPLSGVNRGDDRYHVPLEVHKMTLFKSNLSRNLTSPNPQQDGVFRSSFAGMAHFADTGPAGSTCRECQFWQHTPYDYHSKTGKFRGLIKPCACAKYKAITGRAGALVPDDAMACKYFEFNRDLPKRFA